MARLELLHILLQLLNILKQKSLVSQRLMMGVVLITKNNGTQ